MAQMQNALSVALQLEKVRDKLPLLYECDGIFLKPYLRVSENAVAFIVPQFDPFAGATATPGNNAWLGVRPSLTRPSSRALQLRQFGVSHHHPAARRKKNEAAVRDLDDIFAAGRRALHEETSLIRLFPNREPRTRRPPRIHHP